jgi:pimeloyl-ACP methyl ester carboxylesterase
MMSYVPQALAANRLPFLDPGKPPMPDLQAGARHRQSLGTLMAPTLVLVGEHGPTETRDVADILEKEIPNVSKQSIPNTRYLVNMEQPELFNQIVLDFLQTKQAP